MIGFLFFKLTEVYPLLCYLFKERNLFRIRLDERFIWSSILLSLLLLKIFRNLIWGRYYWNYFYYFGTFSFMFFGNFFLFELVFSLFHLFLFSFLSSHHFFFKLYSTKLLLLVFFFLLFLYDIYNYFCKI